MRKLAIFLLFVGCCSAQIYTVTKQTSLTGAAEVITVQQPATAPRIIRFIAASVDCTVACTFTLEQIGAPATSTTLAVNAVTIGSVPAAAKAVAFSGSNVGTSTVIGNYGISAGGSKILDLSNLSLVRGDQSNNLTIRTNSITGVVQINIVFKESDN